MLNDFLNSKTPMMKARAERALMQQVRVNGGEIMTRKELIERRVSNGAVIKLVGGEEVLSNKDGSFATKADFTKTAIEYAKFLLGNAK